MYPFRLLCGYFDLNAIHLLFQPFRLFTDRYLIKSAKDLETIKGFFGRISTLAGDAGFGMYSELHVIPTLPYIDSVIPNSILEEHYSVNLINADAQGKIEVVINNQNIKLSPGEDWTSEAEQNPTSDCHIVVTRMLTNYGLLDKSQIKY
jgi:hypothetical protein